MNPTILTHSGQTFNLINPDPATIRIEDVAHALSHLCRFTGHCRDFYSVAEHSYLSSYAVPSSHALEALLHDAAEAYIGDVSSPLKRLLPDYQAIEQRVEAAIRRRFGLPEIQSACIKVADLAMLGAERRDLMPRHSENWALLDGVDPIGMSVWPPMSIEGARKSFLLRFQDLTAEAQVAA